MKTSLCEQLDAYLGGSLGDSERDEFTAHLELCDECRREVELGGRIDGLLAAAVAQQPMPGGLLPRVAARIRRVQRRRRVVVGLSVAAVVVVCVAVGRMVFDRGNNQDAGPSIKNPPVVQKTSPERRDVKRHVAQRPVQSPPVRPYVRVDLPDDTIGVPVKTDNPNVTIIMVYPTVSTAYRGGSPKPADR
jgi:anti-sigma factor RsiW